MSTAPAPVRTTGRTSVAFWIVAALFTAFLLAASAPSPLYGLYAATWHFSALVLTAVFAVYALALLGTLLVAGSLSDAIGRRPVLVAGVLLQLIAMGLFLAAEGLGWLIAARVAQGAATGLVTAAIAATLIDLQPAHAPGRGSLVNSVTPTIGLAAGALMAGALVQYVADPLRTTFWVLLALFVVLGAGLLLVPETVTARRRPSLRPRFGVGRSARSAFLAATPALIATWALGGFFLSLGPSVAYLLVGSTNRLVGGAAVALLTGAGAVASLTARSWAPRRAMLAGCIELVVGAVLLVLAAAIGSPVVFFAGTLVAGLGFGTAFLGTFRTLAALATPTERGALVGAVYIVAYLAFALPAVLAGILAVAVGLQTTVVVYGALVALLAALAIPATVRAVAR